jgi:hypothetical protein
MISTSIVAGSTISLPMVSATARPKTNGATNPAAPASKRARRTDMAREAIIVATTLLLP